jgi:hypothetical protein
MDQLAGLTAEDAASAVAPGTTAADIEKIKTDLASAYEERIKGFQKLVSQRDESLAALTADLEELKVASLPEEEREQLVQSKKDREIQELRTKLELRELAEEYGSEMPYFERLLAAGSAKDQLTVMREFAQGGRPVAPEIVADAPVEVPDVDMNRPLRGPSEGLRLADGTLMNDALADQILGSVGRQADVTQRRIRPSE